MNTTWYFLPLPLIRLLAASALHTALLSNSLIYLSAVYTAALCYHDCTELKKNSIFIFQASIVLKSLILLFIHLISLCCPVLFQARPIDSLNRTSNINVYD